MFVLDLPALLVRQQDYDEKFHKEIAWLPPDIKAKHYTLHVAKYVARLVEIRRAYQEVYWHKTLADIFIVALSATNAWNVHVSLFEASVLDPSVQEKMTEYVDQRKAVSLALIPWFQEELALIVGSMARACEQLDHGETVDYTHVLKLSVVNMFILVLAIARLLDVDLKHIVEMRWESLEHRV